ncbi:MAG: PLP-dependent transferase [Clostridiales bacterium]|nr:MAG: PLP-dependent transferase [Clostridiales bacterium]
MQKAEFINPKYDPKTGICGEISPEDVKKACENFDGASLVIITSPTYEGVISDVGAICKTAHKFNIPVLVDEAHGAHLSFGNFEKSAVHCGADIVVQSLHKTLASLTQTAILHVCSPRVDTEKNCMKILRFFSNLQSVVSFYGVDRFACAHALRKRRNFFRLAKKDLMNFYQKNRKFK